MTTPLSRSRFRLLSWIESMAFYLSRLAAAPAWLAYTLARPKNKPLDYEQLLTMARQYRTITKSTEQDVHQHQLKWAGRASRIANLYSARSALEVGCGHGIAAHYLQKAGLEVHANDIQDIRDPAVRAAGIPFTASDACSDLPYPDGRFDLVFSINSFEHFEDPAAALDQMLRVTRPGGLIYLTFDPLYYSPWGLHAQRRLGMPYPQILFPPEVIQRFVDEKRGDLAATYSEGSDRTKIGPPLNCYSLGQYRQIFRQRKEVFRLLAYTERTSLDGLGMIVRYARHFKANVPSFEDLIVGGIKLLGVKQEQ